MVLNEQCSSSENIVRAIRSSHWDSNKNRWSSALFCGPDTSVARLSILPLPELFRIFFSDLHKPPHHRVIKVGEINVGALKSVGQAHVENKKSRPIAISVVPDPVMGVKGVTDNPAHALIKEKLPKSLAHEIIAHLSLHDAPSPWRRILWRVKRLFVRFP